MLQIPVRKPRGEQEGPQTWACLCPSAQPGAAGWVHSSRSSCSTDATKERRQSSAGSLPLAPLFQPRSPSPRGAGCCRGLGGSRALQSSKHCRGSGASAVGPIPTAAHFATKPQLWPSRGCSALCSPAVCVHGGWSEQPHFTAHIRL